MNRRKDFSNRFNSRPRWFDLRAREGAIERSRFLRFPPRVFRRFRGSLYSSLHNNRGVHASVIYVISEVFFGSIRLERRARTRVQATPGLKPCNRFNVKQYTGQLYAIRLCARDKPPTLFLFANRLSRGARARTRVSAPASGFSRERPRDRLVQSYQLDTKRRFSLEFLRGFGSDARFVFRGSGEFYFHA